MSVGLRPLPFLSLLAAAALALPAQVGAAEREVRIVRDDYGVPHIYADDLGALFFGFGHAVAQDRLYQLEMARRSGWGTVSEVLGPDFVKLDRDRRRLGYSREQVSAQIAALALEYQTMLGAYAEGINDAIDSIERGRAKLPVEFERAGFRPAAWSGEDIAQIFISFMATRYSDGHGQVEARDADWLQKLTTQFGPETARVIFDDLIQLQEDPEMITSIPRGEKWRERAVPAPRRVSGVVPPGTSRVAF